MGVNKLTNLKKSNLNQIYMESLLMLVRELKYKIKFVALIINLTLYSERRVKNYQVVKNKELVWLDV